MKDLREILTQREARVFARAGEDRSFDRAMRALEETCCAVWRIDGSRCGRPGGLFTEFARRLAVPQDKVRGWEGLSEALGLLDWLPLTDQVIVIDDAWALLRLGPDLARLLGLLDFNARYLEEFHPGFFSATVLRTTGARLAPLMRALSATRVPFELLLGRVEVDREGR